MTYIRGPPKTPPNYPELLTSYRERYHQLRRQGFKKWPAIHQVAREHQVAPSTSAYWIFDDVRVRELKQKKRYRREHPYQKTEKHRKHNSSYMFARRNLPQLVKNAFAGNDRLSLEDIVASINQQLAEQGRPEITLGRKVVLSYGILEEIPDSDPQKYRYRLIDNRM